MSEVRRRHVFFVAGFDPKGASWYHGLYARESRRQHAVSGARYQVGPRRHRPTGNDLWQVDAQVDGARVQSTVEHVRWDDVVRQHWPRGKMAVLAAGMRGYAAVLASPRGLRRAWRTSPRTLLALGYPAAFWGGAALAGAALGAATAALLALPAWAGGLAGLAAALGGALHWESRLHTTWLVRIQAFAARWGEQRLPEVQRRIDQLASDIRTRLDDPSIDEVLVVGFSVGSLLAASAVARLRTQAAPTGQLALLTLGQCLPLVGLLRGADAFREEIAGLGRGPRVTWVDFSAITDWGSFAGADPLALCLGPAPDRPHAPRMLSPRFHTLFTPAEYAALVRDKRRVHLQYLMAGTRAGTYDYFDLTAGPRRLADRLASPEP